jgi:hypothetical protein
MLSQARELKAKLDQAQKELGNTLVEGNAGRGAVKVIMDGKQKIKSIEISPKVIDPEKSGQLEELVLKAIADAVAKSQKVAAKQLKGLTGGLKIPGLF